MTIAISVKVHDGVVLAADSATTFFAKTQSGETIPINVYNHADKIFNLRKGLPVAALTWGSGSIGPASIASRLKELRRRLTGEDSSHTDWCLDPSNYTMAEVAARFCEMIYGELYEPTFTQWPEKPGLGFLIAGYSAGAAVAEEFQIEMGDLGCSGPVAIRGLNDFGWYANGEPEAVIRLALGHGTNLPAALAQTVPDAAAQAVIFNEIRSGGDVGLVEAGMPVPDAIELAAFFADVSVKFARFRRGPNSVGGAIDVAVITPHEGFKWVRRKHYYSQELNPPMVD